eukprot:COSAG02_NODE_16792_length_1055_cov_1.414226_1_plen_61_part_00
MSAGLNGSAAENQSYLVDYENTFDDFNEMAIQYGYLALFSPAYPLAPLLICEIAARCTYG